jgi:hypothetical protein
MFTSTPLPHSHLPIGPVTLEEPEKDRNGKVMKEESDDMSVLSSTSHDKGEMKGPHLRQYF